MGFRVSDMPANARSTFVALDYLENLIMANSGTRDARKLNAPQRKSFSIPEAAYDFHSFGALAHTGLRTGH